MSRTVYTSNLYHLGDNLIFLHLLRALAKSHVSLPFVHFCHGCNIGQLQDVVEDLPNILLEPFESPLWPEHEREAIDTWKNAEGFWEGHAHRWDWSAFTLAHHAWTAARMGFVSPFTCREHLLFDYPALGGMPARGFTFDFLIGDSEPSSGQYSEWADHSRNPLESLVRALEEKGFNCIRTSEAKKSPSSSISKIGQWSLAYRHHIMVANGPFWPTMNVHNHHAHEGRRRIVLLDNGERLNMPGIEQCATVDEVMQIAMEEKWI